MPENFRHLSPRISSSGEPAGAGVFRALRNEGVQTIISVDGAAPDVETAKREGLRYIHLPIGYDGVPKATVAALDQVLKTTGGPILVHCHHGKHRGPAAAVTMCMIEGSLTRDQALVAMQKAGTSPDYSGLWRDVREFSTVSLTHAARPLVEQAETEPLVDSMVRIDHAFEQMETLLKTQPPRLAKAQEQAVVLMEGYKESSRHVRDNRRSAALMSRLSISESLTKELLTAFHRKDEASIQHLQTRIKADCKSCHAKFRN